MSNTASDVFRNPNYLTPLTAEDQLFRTPDGHTITRQDDRIHTFVRGDNGRHKFYLGKYEVSHAWGNYGYFLSKTSLDRPDVQVQWPGPW